MNLLAYSLFLVFIYPLSYLPLTILYGLSDVLRYILYYVVGYRREVVYSNLRRALPGKSEKEIKLIAWTFYRNLSDLVMETIKLQTISKKQIERRFPVDHQALLNEMAKNGKTAIGMTAHFSNWEMAMLRISLFSDHQVVIVYKTLSNRYFDKHILRIRERFGLKMVEMKDVARAVIELKDTPSVFIFAADQNPVGTHSSLWTTFMGTEAPFFTGPAKIAIKHGYPFMCMLTQRTKRGYFQGDILMIEEDPTTTTEEELTKKYIRMVEDHIFKDPAQWLWSHKRWKHQKPKTID